MTTGGGQSLAAARRGKRSGATRGALAWLSLRAGLGTRVRPRVPTRARGCL
jgi:hypothetical protein